MNKENFNKLVKKALMLETKFRTQFLNDIEDAQVKKELEFLLSDETKATDFIVKTSFGVSPLKNFKIRELKAGDKIKQFIIVKLIAKGGMGSVYLGYDEKLKRNVAIKTIRAEFIHSETSQKRFELEAQILSQINHPNICQIFEYIDYEDGELLILELIDGETLNNFGYSQEQMLDIFIQITSALQAAHAKGVIHRDLKPDNIMLNTEGKIKILDFGIAKSKAQNFNSISKNFIPNKEKLLDINITKAGSLMGTLVYMSPEQAAQKEVTPASDIYSLGILIHLFLTNKAPYELNDTDNLHQKVMNAELELSEKLPNKFRALIESLTAQNPLKRPNAKEVERSLKSIKNLPKEKKRKNKNIALLTIAFALVSLLFFQWENNNSDLKKSDFINQINQNINEIKVTLKNIYGLPIHDITADKKKLNKSRDEIIATVKTNNLLDKVEKHSQIGKVYLANENYKLAEQEFSKAWNLGDNSEELAQYLSITYSFLYNLSTIESERNTGSELSERYKNIQEKYLNALKTYFRLSSMQYQKENSIPNALILWHSKEQQAASSMLGEILDSQDWSFEAYTLKAFFVAKLAGKEFKEGKGYEANRLFNEAKSIYQSAINRGRSFAEAYGGLCYVELVKIITALEVTGEVNMEEDYKTGVIACEDFLKLTKDKVFAYNRLSQINLYYGNYSIKNGSDAFGYFSKALDWNTKSLEIEKSFMLYDTRASIFTLIAQLKQESGDDPSLYIDEAIENMDKTLAFHNKRDYYTYATMLYANLIKMSYELYSGINPLESLKQSITINDLGMSANGINNDGRKYLYMNLANAWTIYMSYQLIKNENLNESLSEVEELMKNLILIFPDEVTSYNVLAEAYYIQAKYLNKNKLPFLKVVKKALENNKKSQELIKPDASILYMNASIFRELELAKNKEVPSYQINFDNSIDQFKKSLKANSNTAIIYGELAITYLYQAKVINNKKDSLKLGIDACKKSHEINPKYPFSYITQAQLLSYGIKQEIFSKSKNTEIDQLYKKARSINPLLVK